MRMVDLSSAATPRPNGGLLRGARGGDEIDGVRRGVIKGDVLPGLEGSAKRRAASGGVGEDLRTSFQMVPPSFPAGTNRSNPPRLAVGPRCHPHGGPDVPPADLRAHAPAATGRG